ncbi:amidase [Pollutimonas harenae]|uniref:Amidase n=1 Tax=Pollutimonas harenae TaxID=657015 RepID=A0A853GYF6_9BURK|nr:amidase [Pollutimonas harenae]NYT84419.1 amidase [Pollutimonas harenae]TEA73180.1 amidase [Pollutimonas harenae]
MTAAVDSASVMAAFDHVAEGLAALNQYPFTDRGAPWAERLNINLPELKALQALTDEAGAHYRFELKPLAGEGVAPSAAANGVAAISRNAHLPDAKVAQAALLALHAAHRHEHLNAFIQLTTESSIMAQADALTAIKHQASLPLLGVPIAIKDLMAVQGFPLTGGTQAPADNPPSTEDGLAVRRLREAGALFVGTTNLHELAYGITSNNPHYGAVLNPYDTSVIPGGSSGGSAAAVAAGIVRASIGTDTSGSIRIPAACCGVVGFKPSYDVVPRQGALDLGPTLDHIGPIARSVDDAALLFAVMAGLPAQVPQRLASLAGIRIGVPANYFFEPLASDVQAAMQAALESMAEDGAQLVPIQLDDIDLAPAIQFATLCSEATAIHWRRLLAKPGSLGPDVRVRLEIGQLLPAIWYTRAQGARTQLAKVVDAALADVDVIVTPTMRTTAPPVSASHVQVGQQSMPMHTAVTGLTLPFNLIGLPAITLPCGRGERGLPVGLQLASGRQQDWKLLAVAARAEALLPEVGIGHEH